MPTKNAERHVRLAVISTLAALPRSSELIVVNDASTDGTVDRLSSLRDSRIRVVQGLGDGIVGALNLGLKLSNGNFVARMDSDDVCLPWRFSSQLRKMRANPGLDFVFSTAIVFGRPLAPFYIAPQLPWSLGDGDFRRILSRRNPAVHPTMLARAAAMRSLEGYSDCPAEDEELWLRASLQNYKLARIGLPGIALRLHSEQTTRQGEWLSRLHRDSKVIDLRGRLRQVEEFPESEERPLFRALDFLDGSGLDSLRLLAKNLKSRWRRSSKSRESL